MLPHLHAYTSLPDTGWIDLKTSGFIQPAWTDTETGGSGRGAHAIKRIGPLVFWLTYWYQNNGGNGIFGTLPTGFTLPTKVPGGGYGTQEVGRSGSTYLQIQNGTKLIVAGHSGAEIRIGAQWPTTDPWPEAYPPK